MSHTINYTMHVLDVFFLILIQLNKLGKDFNFFIFQWTQCTHLNEDKLNTFSHVSRLECQVRTSRFYRNAKLLACSEIDFEGLELLCKQVSGQNNDSHTKRASIQIGDLIFFSKFIDAANKSFIDEFDTLLVDTDIQQR